jgi:hypothetical protein
MLSTIFRTGVIPAAQPHAMIEKAWNTHTQRQWVSRLMGETLACSKHLENHIEVVR